MLETNERFDRITQRLHEHYAEDLGIPVYTVELLPWQHSLRTDHHYGPCASAGWAWPCWEEDPRNIITLFCPALICKVTEGFDEEELYAYLDIIDYVCDLHIAYWDETDPWVRHQRILDEVAEKFPGSLQLLQEVQLKAQSQL